MIELIELDVDLGDLAPDFRDSIGVLVGQSLQLSTKRFAVEKVDDT